MKDKRVILLDIDNTLYPCREPEAAAVDAVVTAVASALALPRPEVERTYSAARRAVKERLDERGASHSRLLYISELVHALGRPDALGNVRTWERTFWGTFLGVASLRPRARTFLEAARRAGRKVAVVSDLTLETQLWKLESLGVLHLVDALVTSEEVPLDKPDEAIFRLALIRVGASPEECVVVGDRDDKDGEGARRLGIAYFRVDPHDPEGTDFDVLARELGIADT